MKTPQRILFLPGASGNTDFWRPVADLLTIPGDKIHFGWPGFGPTPPDPAIQGIDDLVRLVIAEITGPSALIAQSMGGVIALLAALEKPELVTHLVLTATSGGMNLAALGAKNWRPAFMAANPTYPEWFADYSVDLTDQLGTLDIPVLLLWGDSDPISPPAVGEKLRSLLPHAELHILNGGTHDLGFEFADAVALLIDEHLAMTWQLWRQDDNGHRFLVGEYRVKAAAEAKMAELMVCIHKQTYWIEQAAK
jgi:pimeloyl-ACP methyl ester carboxylesterase